MPVTLYHRGLGRKSSHRQAMLRNLVTSLFTHEAITTTWPRAKETQRIADKVITLAKRNTDISKRKAEAELWHPTRIIPTIFGPLRKRYEKRQGGYTRVLRMGLREHDKADIAMISLVDGPRDMRFWMTAATVANQLERGQNLSQVIEDVMAEKEGLSETTGLPELTIKNIHKSLQLRGREGKNEFIETVKMFEKPGKPVA